MQLTAIVARPNRRAHAAASRIRRQLRSRHDSGRLPPLQLHRHLSLRQRRLRRSRLYQAEFHARTICTKPWNWCARWILPASPAAICAIACCTSCATTRQQLRCSKNGNGDRAQVLARCDRHRRPASARPAEQAVQRNRARPSAARSKPCSRRWSTSALSIRAPACATTKSSPA